MIIKSLIEFVLGSLLHFAYNYFPCFLTFVIAPINESVFQHVKLIFYTMLIVDIVLYIRKKDKTMIFPMFIGMLFSMLCVICIYYPIVYGFNVQSLIVDIGIFFVALVIGNMIQEHYQMHSHTKYYKGLLGIILCVIIFTYLTLYPLSLSIFH